MKKMIQTKFNHEIQYIGYVSYNLVRITNMYSISSGFFLINYLENDNISLVFKYQTKSIYNFYGLFQI